MADNSNAPIIIKRKKKVVGGGHHGGAWKVAYADFVTAMMAFFLLMWLLNATTEQQKKGIADYFSPTVTISRVSGGGDGLFAGTNAISDDSVVQDGNGEKGGTPFDSDPTAAERAAAEVAVLEEVQAELVGIGGESLLQQEALRHVITRLTDEGLVIEVYARENAPLFLRDGTDPSPLLVELSTVFARVFETVTNPVAIEGHTRSLPLVVADHPIWEISTGRAAAVRDLLIFGGLDEERMARLTGHGDNDPATPDALAVRNDRIEITLLRTETGEN